MSQREKLEQQLAKVEDELDKCRTSALSDGWQTQKHARKSRNWDYWAGRKRQLQDQLETLDNG